MDLKVINCKCPKCGIDFKLGEALEEHAIEQVRSEFVALNNDDIQRRIDAEKKQALEQGKQQTQQKILEQAEAHQKALDKSNSELTALKLKKFESGSGLSDLPIL